METQQEVHNGTDDCRSFPLCKELNLEENLFGSAITINFNKKYKFLADEKLVKTKSNLLKRMIEKNPQKTSSFKLKLPHFEYISFWVDYLKTGKYCKFQFNMFPTIFNNALYLECFELISDLEFIFAARYLDIVHLPQFQDHISNQNFQNLMFAHTGKDKIRLNIEKNGPNEYCQIFYEISNIYKNLDIENLNQTFPYLWKLSIDFDLPLLKKDLETQFEDLISKYPNYIHAHEDMNSNFISHEDFKYLLVCYLDLRLTPIFEKPDILTINEEHCFILKNWLEKHPNFIDEWYETFRFILALL